MNEDFKIIRNAVSQELCEFLALEFNMMEDVCKIIYPDADLSDMCKNSFARYAPLMFEALSVKLLPLVEEAVGMKLWPTYSFARIYYTGSELQKHFDRPSSEITLSVCITHDAVDWPLKIEGTNKQVHEIFLNVGDLVIYSGRKHMHWRDPFQGTKQIQAFLQYVDANGPDAWLKWDTKQSLGLGFEWTRPEIQNELKRIAAMESLIKNSNQN
jgi:hypothetical protein